MNIRAALTALFLSLSLTNCVDTTSSTLAEGGMTGTGISTGRITGFGSIYVNGIRYNVDQAEFYRNGAKVSGQNLFNVGEFITITGVNSNDGSNGTAAKVNFDSLITGEITAIAVNSTTIEVMGQTVQTDDLTVLHGFTQLTELALGNIVEISGTRNAEGIITATSITRLHTIYPNDGSVLRLEGTISGLNTDQHSFQLGDLTVDYSISRLEGLLPNQTLQNGFYVQVETQQVVQGSWVIASTLHIKPQSTTFPPNTIVRMEGIVTAVQSNTAFTLNKQPVIITSTTVLEDFSLNQLVTDIAIEVEGTIDANGNLLASRMHLRQANDAQVIHQAGIITALDTNQKTFVLQGQHFFVDNTSMLLGERDAINHHTPINFNALAIGMTIAVDAVLQNDGRLKVIRLDKNKLPPPHN